jgi:hypothetical protein
MEIPNFSPDTIKTRESRKIASRSERDYFNQIANSLFRDDAARQIIMDGLGCSQVMAYLAELDIFVEQWHKNTSCYYPSESSLKRAGFHIRKLNTLALDGAGEVLRKLVEKSKNNRTGNEVFKMRSEAEMMLMNEYDEVYETYQAVLHAITGNTTGRKEEMDKLKRISPEYHSLCVKYLADTGEYEAYCSKKGKADSQSIKGWLDEDDRLCHEYEKSCGVPTDSGLFDNFFSSFEERQIFLAKEAEYVNRELSKTGKDIPISAYLEGPISPLRDISRELNRVRSKMRAERDKRLLQ